MKAVTKEEICKREKCSSVLLVMTCLSYFAISYPGRFASPPFHPAPGWVYPGAFLWPLLSPPCCWGRLTPGGQVKNRHSPAFLRARTFHVFPPDCQASCVKDIVVKLYKLQPLEKKDHLQSLY